MSRRLLLVALLLTSTACGAPAGPDPQPAVVITFVDPAGALDARRDAILRLIGQSLDRVGAAFDVGAVSITVDADPGGAIPGWGLADRFSIELLGVSVPPWSQAFPEAQHARYLALAAPHFDAMVNHGIWFFGASGEPPRWTGYTLGFRLVADYQARTGLSAAQLVNTSAGVFRPQ